jgi:tetratricopeptide (TPR) repeat protein
MNTPSQSPTPSATAQDTAALDAARARLARLESYLEADPANDTLLTDAFQTALRCAEWEKAKDHLASALRLQSGSLPWALHEAEFFLAQQKYDEAAEVLAQLAAIPSPPPGLADAVLHNLAYIDFAQARYGDCVARLADRLEGPPGEAGQSVLPATDLPPALPTLWLRALHRAGELERAVRWSQAMASAGQLSPQLAGIASLAALDFGDLGLAQQWSELAGQGSAGSQKTLEAWVTQASLSLAAQDAGGAQASAAAALQLNPRDGRAWSVMAFADLLGGQAQKARVHFAQALEAMPEHIGTWHGQAWNDLVLKDLDAAQRSFETALALDRNFAESHGGLAVVLALKKHSTEARKHIELAQRLDPSNLSGRYAQAVMSGEASDTQAFQKLVHRLLGNRAGLFGGSMEDDVGKALNGRKP